MDEYTEVMSYVDLVQKHIPNADESFAEFVLWEKTAFPIVKNLKILEEQIMKFAEEINHTK